MHDISMVKCSDGAIWTTSDEDQNGTDSVLKGNFSEEAEFLFALIDFLGLTQTQVINLMQNTELYENEGQCIQESWGYEK